MYDYCKEHSDYKIEGLDPKQVHFGKTVVIKIPKEDRSGSHWFLDRLRFEKRVKDFEELYKSRDCEKGRYYSNKK